MASSYDPPNRSRYNMDWSRDGTPRRPHRAPSGPYRTSRRSSRSNNVRPPSPYRPTHSSGQFGRSAGSTFPATRETGTYNMEQPRRHRHTHSVLEITLQDGLQADGQPGREDNIGYIRPFPEAVCPATHLAKAKEFLDAVSYFIPEGTANHQSRYTDQVATYIYDIQKHPSVAVVRRSSNIPKKPEMLQLIVRVEDEKAWKSEKVWDSDSVFSM